MERDGPAARRATRNRITVHGKGEKVAHGASGLNSAHTVRAPQRRRTALTSLAAALLVLLVAALTACSSGPADDPDAPVMTVQVTAIDMRFEPNVIEVPTGTRLVVEFTNTDQTQLHDLTFENGVGTTRLGPNASETITVGVINDDLDGWCTIAGHRQQGMVLTVVAVDPEGAPSNSEHPDAGRPEASGQSGLSAWRPNIAV